MDGLRFKIYNLDWDLFLVPESSTDIGGIDCLGETDYIHQEIKINQTLSKSAMKRTLIHELTHAFRWTYGNVSESEVLNTSSGEMEEIIANTVEVFGEDIIKLANKLMKHIEKEVVIC